LLQISSATFLPNIIKIGQHLNFFLKHSVLVLDTSLRIPVHPSGIKPHAYFIVPQGLNCRENHANRKKLGYKVHTGRLFKETHIQHNSKKLQG